MEGGCGGRDGASVGRGGASGGKVCEEARS